MADWQPIETAPHAMHVIAAKFEPDFGEWTYGIVFSPPQFPWTHWQPLPEPPVVPTVKQEEAPCQECGGAKEYMGYISGEGVLRGINCSMCSGRPNFTQELSPR